MTAEQPQEHEAAASPAGAAVVDTGHPAAAGSHAPPETEVPFSKAEIAGFDNDDSLAGRAIGKLLSSFFLYTVIVMAAVAWWTFSKLR